MGNNINFWGGEGVKPQLNSETMIQQWWLNKFLVIKTANIKKILEKQTAKHMDI